MKESTTIWEYKVGSNAIIANFVCMWKIRFVVSHLYRDHYYSRCWPYTSLQMIFPPPCKLHYVDVICNYQDQMGLSLGHRLDILRPNTEYKHVNAVNSILARFSCALVWRDFDVRFIKVILRMFYKAIGSLVDGVACFKAEYFWL